MRPDTRVGRSSNLLSCVRENHNILSRPYVTENSVRSSIFRGNTRHSTHNLVPLRPPLQYGDRTKAREREQKLQTAVMSMNATRRSVFAEEYEAKTLLSSQYCIFDRLNRPTAQFTPFQLLYLVLGSSRDARLGIATPRGKTWTRAS
jgi:hypothetical protein